MANYVSFSSTGSTPLNSQPSDFPADSSEYEEIPEQNGHHPAQQQKAFPAIRPAMRTLLKCMGLGSRRPQAESTSRYLTLIPLDDNRLKPRNTKLIVTLLLLLTFATTCAVYFLVPRGFSVGTVSVCSTQMMFNVTSETYELVLKGKVDVFNPNYLAASVSGNIKIQFYDQQAGIYALEPKDVVGRANPQPIWFTVNASNVPRIYHWTVVEQCHQFPKKVIFFLLGDLQATFYGKTYRLPKINTYFIINCTSTAQQTTC